MNDYKELIDKLRIAGMTEGHCEILLNAADAIEQLVKERDAAVAWHKVTTRPLTEEEKAYYAEMEIGGIEYIFDCEMPEDGQEILVATKWGTDKDICCNDCDYGIGLEGRGDWDGVYAWAEMPQYKEVEHE